MECGCSSGVSGAPEGYAGAGEVAGGAPGAGEVQVAALELVEAPEGVVGAGASPVGPVE